MSPEEQTLRDQIVAEEGRLGVSVRPSGSSSTLSRTALTEAEERRIGASAPVVQHPSSSSSSSTSSRTAPTEAEMLRAQLAEEKKRNRMLVEELAEYNRPRTDDSA
jgi:membrane-bound ClpP family serine protease